ncbi:MAG: 1-deoxy-D-xylulose-5-phosphate synthase, partial [Candidatus Eremiobacteraeota bacterium]|nr:1-deoxy-D-xylulose-5-phosphate synthase [Candidatus Eremiobacteraeota bacterium]
DRIAGPADVKRLSRPEIDQLATEIRTTLVDVCSKNGGHLAPNLGVVELTLALHAVLDLPRDRIVWDVSHQSYVHKLLTGRRDRFPTLRQGGGISGFSMRSESPFDVFGAGHASTSVSAALGMVKARDLAGEDSTIVAVIGDGALTGGLAYEAINNAGELKTNFIVILNDNEMSIAPNVGSIASYLGVLRSKPLYNVARETVKSVLGHIPFGGTVGRAITTGEQATMRFWSPEHKAGIVFEEMGFRYIGPIDGHHYDTLVDVISNARKVRGPVLVHVRTIKGKGYDPAELDSRTFHGCGAFDIENGKIEKKAGARKSHSEAFADALIAVAERDPRVIGITAAMPDGTQLAKFHKRFPERYFDVGIAEAHAVCFAAGAATSGLRPVVAIYSTFLQRAYDQIVHDVVVQNLPVVFCMDRAGFVGDDGPTHMGLYDIAYLRTLPNMTVMAPRNEDEILPMLAHAIALGTPAAIRYPRGSTSGKHLDPLAPLVQGKAEVLRRGEGVALVAFGNTVDVALDAYDLLGSGEEKPTVVNARFAKPLDEALLCELGSTHRKVVTLEEHSLDGGFGSAVVELFADRGIRTRVERVGCPNLLVQQNAQPKQRAGVGLSPEAIAERVRVAVVAEPALA